MSAVSQDGKFRKKKSYAIVSNFALRDKNLSNKAKGLYAIISSYLTMDDDFELYKSFLINSSTDGIRSFNTAWDELKNTGYLKQRRIRTENSFTYEYDLLDEPDLDTPPTINIKLDGSISEKSSACKPKEKTEKKTINKNILDIDVEEHKEAFKNENITSNNIDEIAEKIKEQIDYETHKLEDDPYIDNILNIMIEIAVTDGYSVKVGKESIPTIALKQQFKKIDRLCIEDILTSLREYDKPIKNPRAFLIKALYNAPKTAYTRIYSEQGITPNDAISPTEEYNKMHDVKSAFDT